MVLHKGRYHHGCQGRQLHPIGNTVSHGSDSLGIQNRPGKEGAAKQRNGQQNKQCLISEQRIVWDQNLKAQSVVQRHIEPVAGEVNQVIGKGPFAHGEEHEQVIEQQNNKPTVIDPQGEILLADHVGQIKRAMTEQPDIERSLRLKTKVEGRFRVCWNIYWKQEQAVVHRALFKGPHVTGGDVLPLAILARSPEIQDIN